MALTLPVPATIDDITPEWLNQVLDPGFRGGATVVACSADIISAGIGFVGDVARLSLEYDRPAAGAVSTVIAKVPTANPSFRPIGQLLGFFQKEIGFYRHVAPTLDIAVPRAYYLGEDHATGNFILLLEDLAGMEPGDQLASCSREVAELAVREVARLHARWWAHPDLARFAEWLPGPGDLYFQILEGAYKESLPRFPEVFGHLVDPKILEFAEIFGDRYQDAIAAGVDRTPTFIHGDYRLDNMLFGDGDSKPRIAILDWQLPFRANALWDVVYFLAGNFDPEWRRANEDDLLRVYHEALLANGVRDYAFDRCRDDYRAAGLVLMGYLVTNAKDFDPATYNERGQRLFEAMFNRYSTAILDLESWTYLPE
ncbi:MAG: hypothetical protein Kow0010_02580 [Dehalococcoidia bacterium]